jgi:hypothetical protein
MNNETEQLMNELVMNELEAVRNDGSTDMLQVSRVAAAAQDLGCDALGDWIAEHSTREYSLLLMATFFHDGSLFRDMVES